MYKFFPDLYLERKFLWPLYYNWLIPETMNRPTIAILSCLQGSILKCFITTSLPPAKSRPNNSLRLMVDTREQTLVLFGFSLHSQRGAGNWEGHWNRCNAGTGPSEWRNDALADGYYNAECRGQNLMPAVESNPNPHMRSGHVMVE